MKPSAQMIDALLEQARGSPLAMFRLAPLMRRTGQEARAVKLCGDILADAATDAGLAAEVRRFLGDGVPAWHFTIVRDEVRNAAYDAALRRLMRPGMRVLEIGTGTGILAMMAARAGAAEVVTCEMNPAIAEAARDVIARNGYADRVRVITGHSETLDLERDLGGRRADLLVSEIVSNDLIGEIVLPAHEHAAQQLLVPGAPVIPARGRIRVALAEDRREGSQAMGEIDGFDLSPFNRLTPASRPVPRGAKRLELRSEAADLFEFDFSGAPCAPAEAVVTCQSSGGRVNGIVQWIALDMDGVTDYENRPGPGAFSCWSPLHYPFPEPIETVAGQEMRIHGAHDRTNLTIRLD